MREVITHVVAWLPLVLIVSAVWFGLRRHARISAESNAQTLGLIAKQTVELKRIADALERRGGD